MVFDFDDFFLRLSSILCGITSSLRHSNQFDTGQNTVPARNVNKGQQAPKPCRRQTLNRIFFEKLWKVNQKVKIVHYFDNYNRIFFSKPKCQTFSWKSGCHLNVMQRAPLVSNWGWFLQTKFTIFPWIRVNLQLEK